MEQFQSDFGALLEQIQSNYKSSAVSEQFLEQFQSNFRAILEQFQEISD